MTDQPTRHFISGLPRSGNRLLKRLVEHLAKEAGRQVIVKVWHGNSAGQTPGPGMRILVPVRDPFCRRQSASKHGCLGPYPEDVCTAGLYAFAGKHGIPVKHVSYEAMVQRPDEIGRDIAEWMGLGWAGWPEEVRDQNAKWLGIRTEAAKMTDAVCGLLQAVLASPRLRNTPGDAAAMDHMRTSAALNGLRALDLSGLLERYIIGEETK